MAGFTTQHCVSLAVFGFSLHRDTRYAVIWFNADASDIRRGGINVRGGVTQTRKKTLIDHRPEEGVRG